MNKVNSLKFQFIKFFKAAVEVRHNIVHRSGKNTDREISHITKNRVTNLCTNIVIVDFAREIDK